ncbi:hypothetical protein ACJX0J_024435, partial [Zea mays]
MHLYVMAVSHVIVDHSHVIVDQVVGIPDFRVTTRFISNDMYVMYDFIFVRAIFAQRDSTFITKLINGNTNFLQGHQPLNYYL